ncbi:511_t:CDS:2, partial [Cetraspora pellucida]
MNKSFATQVEVPKLKDSLLFRQNAFINGEWVKAKSGNTYSVLDPATNKEIGKVPEMNAEDTKEAIKAAKESFNNWANQTAK